MLLVDVRLGASPSGGVAVYAAQCIPRGTLVWRFSPGFDLDLDAALVWSQPELLRERLQHCAQLDPVTERYILYCDHARHIRSGSTPNVRRLFRGWFFQGRYGVDIATRNIMLGEELVRAMDIAGITYSQAPTKTAPFSESLSRERVA